MYRIKLQSGEESEFSSFEELSFSIVSGIIGPDDEIYHARASKWLPIGSHPDYKRAIAQAPPPSPAMPSGSPASPPGGVASHDPPDEEEAGQDLITLLDLEELTAFTKETKSNGKLLIEEPLIQRQLADLWVDLNILRFLSYRVVSLQAQKLVPNYEASIVKVFNSEYGQKLARAGLHMMGLYGQLEPESKYARLAGGFARSYVTSVGATIAAGTSEIQRSIIATRGLGLPRG